MNRDRICSRCRFWDPVSKRGPGGWFGAGGENRPARRGYCRRYAPRAQALSPQWPSTRDTDSCGEFGPRSDAGSPSAAPAAEMAGGPERGGVLADS